MTTRIANPTQHGILSTFTAIALTTLFLAVGSRNPSFAYLQDVEKPTKLSADGSAKLDKAFKAAMLDSSIVQTLLMNFNTVGKDSVTITVSPGAKIGKQFILPEKTTFGVVITSDKKGGAAIAKLVFKAKINVSLLDAMTVEGVELAEGTALDRTPDGNWWVASKEVREQLAARENAKRGAEADKKKQEAGSATDEVAATAKLKNVQELVTAGTLVLARIRCQALIDAHPKTKAAEEARKLLAKLKKS